MKGRRRSLQRFICVLIPLISISVLSILFFPIETSENSSVISERCDRKRTCLDCLFPHSESNSFSTLRLSEKCFWCASTGQCMPMSQKSLCVDRDERACPAVLHSTIPNTFRVIHVAIRKGGPEALIQLHLALNRWGFRTTLDTRHSQKEKGGAVVPFFQKVYQEEFSRAPPLRWVKSYEDWFNTAVEGDVLIATETWPCLKHEFLEHGVRQMQWHLTVWPRRDRSYCTITGHTNYVTMTYMNQSQLALLYPYVSPHIVALAQNKPSWKSLKRKQNALVLYDADTKLTDNDLTSRHAVGREVKKATGFTPERLYELYGEATAGVDLALPGAERFIFEAVLFDVCVIVDNALVGGCKEDIPVPDEFRVPAGDINALNAAIDRCVRDYHSVIGEFDTLKQFTLQQKNNFERQVRHYFSNSAHVVSVVCSNSQSRLYLTRFILNVLLYIPFATVEIRLGEGVSGLNPREYEHLFDQSWLAAVRFVVMSKQETDDVCQVSDEKKNENIQTTNAMTRLALFSRTRPLLSTGKTSLLVLFVPIDIIITDKDIVHYITSQLALRRERRPPNPTEFTLFLFANQYDASLSADLTLLAAWTADATHISCAAVVSTRVPLFEEICQHRQALGHVVRKAVVLREVQMTLATRAASGVMQSNGGPLLQDAWRFMCLHSLWRDLVGGC